ncbi:MAG: C10 family peptidase [Bacteroidales bacterium]|nr:C10 family peptidase [Candidatus Colimorpha onthohippi]
MRRFALVLFLVLSEVMWASPISLSQAYLKASRFVAQQGGPDVQLVEVGAKLGLKHQYLFVGNEGRGFVLVSADSRIMPILGYSLTSSVQLPLPDAMLSWITDYDNQIAKILASDDGQDMQDAWDMVFAGDGSEPVRVIVGPLIQTIWNQRPRYNQLCPSVGDVTCPTGCVATAMAQVLRYWKWPIQGQGNHSYTWSAGNRELSADFENTTYDWNNMPLELKASSTQQEIDAVAQLMYHCGVSASMNYGPNESGAPMIYAANAFKSNFRYKNTCEYKRMSDNESVWDSLLQADLDAGRPVLYSGYDVSTGHAFVCDGYASDGKYHFNWGWGGSYDGFFAIGNLVPQGGGVGTNATNNFSLRNEAVFGIEPTQIAFSVSPNSVEFSRWGDSATICVHSSSQSSSAWTASSTGSWLSLSCTTGSGGGLFTMLKIRAARNNSGADRTAVVTIEHNGQRQSVLVSQPNGASSPVGYHGTDSAVVTSEYKQITANNEVIIRPETFGNFCSGYRVTQVHFKTVDVWSICGRNFEVRIYENCLMNNTLRYGGWGYPNQVMGQLVYSQRYTATEAGMQTVQLDTPYDITTNKTFWISVKVLDYTCFAAAHFPMSDSIDIESYPIYDSLSMRYLYTERSTDGDTIVWVSRTYKTNNPYTDIRRVLQQDEWYVLGFSTERIPVDCSGVVGTVENQSVCDSYTWCGQVLQSSGVYYDSLITDMGCDSVNTLYLTVNYSANTVIDTPACQQLILGTNTITESRDITLSAGRTVEGQCDSSVTYRVAIYPNYQIDTSVTTCHDYVWHGNSYSTSTVAVDSLHSAYGCDSVVRLNLVISLIPEIDTTISACDSYTFADSVYTQSGTYQQLISSNDCGITITLHLTIHPSYHDTSDSSGCHHFTWHDTTIMQSQLLSVTDTTVYGCDSITAVNVRILPTDTTTIPQFACHQYIWNGNIYRSSGTYTSRAQNQYGCDSLTILQLTISSNSTGDTAARSCGPFEWHGMVYAQSGTATYRMRNHAGCDSLVILDLTVLPVYRYDTTIAACDTLTWQGTDYTASTRVQTPYTSVDGCDSIHNTNIKVYPSHDTSVVIKACNRYQWIDNRTYTTTTMGLQRALRSMYGCDSVVHADIIIDNSYRLDVDTTVCDSIRWIDDQVYRKSTTFVYQLGQTAAGCDSVEVVSLTVNPSYHDNVYVVVGYSYRWMGSVFYQSGCYHSPDSVQTLQGCDSVMTLYLTIVDYDKPQLRTYENNLLVVNHYPDGEDHDYVPYFAYRWYRNGLIIEGATSDAYYHANHSTLAGCYQVEVLVNNEDSIWVKSDSVCIGNTDGIGEMMAPFVAVYPNPVQVQMPITITSSTPLDVAIYDVQGRVVLSTQVSEGSHSLSPIHSSGIYTMRLRTSDGHVRTHRLVVR